MTLTDDELRNMIFLGMVHTVVERVRHRRARIAALGAPLSIRASRAERRREARERPARPVRQQPLLTPFARRMDMVAAGDVRLTELDAMLGDDEALALEEWADCEEMLSGRVMTVNWEGGSRGVGQPEPVADACLAQLAAHGRRKAGLGQRSLQVLAAFTALQNGSEGALSAAQYGERLFPGAKVARQAFIEAVAKVAGELT